LSPLGKKLWKMLSINVWYDRHELRDKFGKEGFQNAVSDLLNAGVVELQFRKHDENGLQYHDDKQFIRRKPSDEIVEYYNRVTNPRSDEYNQRIFWEMLVKCPKLKQIKYENPYFYGGDGKKRKPSLIRLKDAGD
jgi:hypothetical protein